MKFGLTCTRCGGEAGVDFAAGAHWHCSGRYSRPDRCTVCGTFFLRLTKERIRGGRLVVAGGREIRWAGKRIYQHKRYHYITEMEVQDRVRGPKTISTDFPQPAEK